MTAVLPSAFSQPGNWIYVSHDLVTDCYHVRVKYRDLEERFEMSRDKAGKNGEKLASHAYFVRAQLHAIDKITQGLLK